METCLTRLPKVMDDRLISGGELANWPERLNAVPPRISKGTLAGITAEIFLREMALWKRRVSYYKTVNNQLGLAGRYRNLLDMNAYLGGFAAALIEDPVWVMNVVPVEAEVNTLGAIYERGLIGTYHSWQVLFRCLRFSVPVLTICHLYMLCERFMSYLYASQVRSNVHISENLRPHSRRFPV